ncbi:hypothetical protein ACPPVW_05285 [Leifsonia sp. McL0607]|uniref:hypothetical protein n=1 Tax=Leifsonia sp. McL0607 TaxID=3415672 RepID=UPI003CE917ED
MRSKTTTLTILAAIPLVLSLLTACSSGVGSPDSDKSASDSPSPIADATEWNLAYAKCMRAEGIDMADPDPNGNTTSSAKGDQGGYSAASKKCIAKIGDSPTAPGEKKQSAQETLARQLEVARCFREHGVEMDDPTEGQYTAIPADAPSDVITACLGEGAQGATQMGSSN